MPDKTDDAVAQAINNLGAESMADVRGKPSDEQLVHDEINVVYDENDWAHELVPRENIHVDVADFPRKHGQAQYKRREPNGDIVEGHHVLRVAEAIVGEDEHDWRDTVRHELAHILVYVENGNSSPGHGDKWKQMAKRVGAEPSRCASTRHTQGDYYIGCPNGCWRNNLHKRSKRVKRPGKKFCNTCGALSVSWRAGEVRPTTPGKRAVDCSDLVEIPNTVQYRYRCTAGCWEIGEYEVNDGLRARANNCSCDSCNSDLEIVSVDD